jgi:sec-independent protein translocase protein TatB
MIDFGLTKMMVIGVVALVVIGPEKLPKVARMAGTLFGRAQRYINEVKAEVSREMELDELHKMHEEVRTAAAAVHQSVTREMAEVQSQVNNAWSGEHNTIAPPRALDAATIARKSKDFRKSRVARAAVPSWYKQKTGHKTRVISAAARVARFRPTSVARKSSFFHD